MARTKAFRETVCERAQRDAGFRKALLRDLINATIGFEQFAAKLQKPGKSLHRMLGPQGNPNTANFFCDSPGAPEENRSEADGEGGITAHRVNRRALRKSWQQQGFDGASSIVVNQLQGRGGWRAGYDPSTG